MPGRDKRAQADQRHFVRAEFRALWQPATLLWFAPQSSPAHVRRRPREYAGSSGSHAGYPQQQIRRRNPPGVVHSSLYLPEAVHEALREAAFHERCKIQDIIMQRIDAALRKRGYPSVRTEIPQLTGHT